SLGYLRSILPLVDPPEDRVPEEIHAAIRDGVFSAGQDEPELINRSARWTYAIFRELDEGLETSPVYKAEPSMVLPAEWRRLNLAVGALDPEFERTAFGIVIHTPIGRSAVIGDVFFPRLRFAFPLVVRTVVEDLHAIPTLTNSSSACWA